MEKCLDLALRTEGAAGSVAPTQTPSDTLKLIIMQTTNLKELRELRTQEKAIKARIDEISTEATNEAVAILAAKGLEKGEFEIEGVGTFQLQRTEVFDFAD